MAGGLSGGVLQRAEARVEAISPEDCLEALGLLLAARTPQSAVLPARWETVARQRHELPPFLSEVVSAVRSDPAAGGPVSILSDLERAPAGSRKSLLSGYLRDQAARVLGLSPSQVPDARKPLAELGLDSLMAVELRNALAASLGRPLPAQLLFDHPTLDEVAAYLLNEELGLPCDEKAAEPSLDETRKTSALAELEQLSEEAAETLLEQTLAALNPRHPR